MIGIGYRREMHEWSFAGFDHSFIEVAPENWLRRSHDRLLELGLPIRFHGVSLNLGGHSDTPTEFLRQVRSAMQELDITEYSDHLAASGDAHQLYDLFPIARTTAEVLRIADRIKAVQDILGCRMAIENAVEYTNIGNIPEVDFLLAVAETADCNILLDVNNLVVNCKNQKKPMEVLFSELQGFSWDRVTYAHIAGHEFSEDFDLYWDTHSARPDSATMELARWADQRGIDLLLEWDNDVPTEEKYREELAWLRSGIM